MRTIAPHTTRRHARARRAFTLTEVLVALGAIAIITVGIAAVFAAVGETISRGQRVSQFTGAATRFEQQIRADLAGVTRDGFLVVRNELIAPANRRAQDFNPTELGELPALSSDDGNPRARRADELLFFANGRFRSARLTPNPRLSAESGSAMIYYGHGIRYPRDLLNAGATAPTQSLQHSVPQLAASVDASSTTSGDPRLRLGGDTTRPRGQRGPNEYAESWTLLRHVTLLRPPSETLTIDMSTTQMVYSFPFSGAGIARFRDSRVQIGGIPAAPSVFAHYGFALDQVSPEQPQGPSSLRFFSAVPGPIFIMNLQNRLTPHHAPTIASGLIDVAATDLGQIRRVVLGAPVEPGPPMLDALSAVPGASGQLARSMALFDRGAIRDTFNPGLTAQPSTPVIGFNINELRRMQLWMLDALPGDGLRAIGENPLATPTTPGPAGGINYRQSRARMRYEPAPPAYFDVLALAAQNSLPADAQPSNQQREYRIADQLMLASSVFLPRCTEFIVEWSFGNTWPGDNLGSAPSEQAMRAGDLIWHGLYRRADVNFDGTLAPNEFSAGPYPVFLGRNTNVEGAQFGIKWGTQPNQFWPVTSEVIHLDRNLPLLTNNAGVERVRVLESVFGYVDPTYLAADILGGLRVEDNLDNQLATASGVPVFSTAQNARFRGRPVAPNVNTGVPAQIPWAWPRLLRFTVTLADANDPTIEETFQFIVELPVGESAS